MRLVIQPKQGFHAREKGRIHFADTPCFFQVGLQVEQAKAVIWARCLPVISTGCHGRGASLRPSNWSPLVIKAVKVSRSVGQNASLKQLKFQILSPLITSNTNRMN